MSELEIPEGLLGKKFTISQDGVEIGDMEQFTIKDQYGCTVCYVPLANYITVNALALLPQMAAEIKRLRRNDELARGELVELRQEVEKVTEDRDRLNLALAKAGEWINAALAKPQTEQPREEDLPTVEDVQAIYEQAKRLPFCLKDALAGKPVVTRDGRFRGLVSMTGNLLTATYQHRWVYWYRDGKYKMNKESDLDLFMEASV